jgi:hypothetical protein
LRDYYCRGKAIGITYSECEFVVLVIKYAVRMRRIILSSVACLAVPNILTFHKHRDFRKKKVTGHKMCVLIFSTNLSKKVSLSKKI